jgi:8-oxo-dGTP pyrophosphatase MutT (NUDIX family)
MSTNILTKDEFIRRFTLNQLSSSTHNYKHKVTKNSPLKLAAVLIGLHKNEENKNQLDIILTKRASHLKHHPSQISFPGGKAEPTDKNLIETALREAEEEIGLCSSNVDVIGQLPAYETISGYHVTPIIGIVKNNPSFTIDPNEVSEVFHVPLSFYLSSQNHYSLDIYKQGQTFKVHFLPYQHYNIWGATASILKDIVLHIT